MARIIIRDLSDPKVLNQNGMDKIRGGNLGWPSSPFPLFGARAGAYAYAHVDAMGGSNGFASTSTSALAYSDSHNFLSLIAFSVTSAQSVSFAVIGAISNGSSIPRIFIESWSFAR